MFVGVGVGVGGERGGVIKLAGQEGKFNWAGPHQHGGGREKK